MNKKGFTLLELIVIIAVVAFVLTPFSYFVSSSLRSEVQTQKMIDADQSTQEIYIIINEALRRSGIKEGCFANAKIGNVSLAGGSFVFTEDTTTDLNDVSISGNALRLEAKFFDASGNLIKTNTYFFYLDKSSGSAPYPLKLRKNESPVKEEILNDHVKDISFNGSIKIKEQNDDDNEITQVQMQVKVNNGIKDIDYKYIMSARE